MSKHNIQNPDHYTIAGRDRPGKAAAQVTPHVTNKAEQDRERWERRRKQKKSTPEDKT
jgi:hypothetical protein